MFSRGAASISHHLRCRLILAVALLPVPSMFLLSVPALFVLNARLSAQDDQTLALAGNPSLTSSRSRDPAMGCIAGPSGEPSCNSICCTADYYCGYSEEEGNYACLCVSPSLLQQLCCGFMLRSKARVVIASNTAELRRSHMRMVPLRNGLSGLHKIAVMSMMTMVRSRHGDAGAGEAVTMRLMRLMTAQLTAVVKTPASL